MARLLFLLLLLCAGLRFSAAQAQTTATTAAAAEATALRQARQLVLERRYEAAWQLLTLTDPTNAVPAVVLEKTDVALNYYANTEHLRRFAFRNLKLLDIGLDSIRQLGTDSLRYAFPVRKVLERLQTRFPDNYKLARALGDYYFTVQQCDCAEAELGEDEVFRRTIRQYQEAHAHGQGDYLSYFALGYAYQRLGRFPESLPPFERALQLRPTYATAHLNLAFVLLELKQFQKAQKHAHRAVELFPDDAHKEDAAFLLGQIEERMRK
jgi:tetratricopeptide (TPR) repeat protein